MKAGFSLCLDGCRVRSERYGDFRNAEKIILFCHGFPGTNRLVRLRESLKKERISLVEINYRGDKKSEGKFSFLGSMMDIRTVAHYLKDNYDVPLHALGYSMGGLYVANIANQEPHIFEKAILLNPVVDAGLFFSDEPLLEELWRSANDVLSLKTPQDYKEEIVLITEKHNPVGFADRLRIPLAVVQSTADEVLFHEIAKRFCVSLKCNKGYYEIPDAGHDLMGDEEPLIRAIVS